MAQSNSGPARPNVGKVSSAKSSAPEMIDAARGARALNSAA